jgi:hypothetical protein
VLEDESAEYPRGKGGEVVTKQGWDTTFLQPLHWSFLSLFLSFFSP